MNFAFPYAFCLLKMNISTDELIIPTKHNNHFDTCCSTTKKCILKSTFQLDIYFYYSMVNYM